MFISARDTGDADIEPIPRYAPRQRTKPNGKRDDIGHRGKALRRSGAFLRYRAAAKDHAAKKAGHPLSTQCGSTFPIVFSAHPLSDISYTFGPVAAPFTSRALRRVRPSAITSEKAHKSTVGSRMTTAQNDIARGEIFSII